MGNSLNQPTTESEDRSLIRKNSHSYKYGYGYAGYQKDRRPRRLNVWLVVATVLVVGIGGPALYFWHSRQIVRLSDALLEHADRMADDENWRDASDAYYRVWEIRKDPTLLGKLATSYDKHAFSADHMGVIGYYQRAIGALPKRHDLRTRLGELLLKTGQSQSAFQQIEKVLDAEPSNEAASKWRALSLLALYRDGQLPSSDINVLSELKEAYTQQVGDFDLAFGLIGHIRTDLKAQNNSELGHQADAVINSLVRAWPNDAKSYLARYQYRVKYSLPGAKRDIDQAMALAPDNPVVIEKGAWDALHDATTTNRNSANYLATRQLFKRLIELQPESPSGYRGLGDVEYLVKGDIEQAIQIWNEGRTQAGDSLPLLLRIAEGQTNLYKYDDAEQTIDDVKRYLASLSSKGAEEDRNWATASAALFSGKIKLAKNQPYEAIPDFQLAAALGTDQALDLKTGKSTAFSALLSLGKTYAKLGQLKNGAASYNRALAIQPESETALLAAADAWSALGDLDRAIGYAERALQLPNTSAKAHRYLAQYLLEQQIARPRAERSWIEFEDAFRKARWQLADSWRLRLIDVDYATRRIDQQDVSNVLGKLLSIESDFPDEIQVWRRLPFIYESIGSSEEADRALNRLEEITSSSPESKFVLVDILLARKKISDAQIVLDGISEDQLTPQEAWFRDLAQLRVTESGKDPAKTDELLAQLIAKYPMNVSLVERMLDRRLSKTSTSTTPTNEQLIQTLKERQENAEPNWQYFAARLLLAQPEPDMNEVRNLLASLRSRLPYWSRTQELIGRIAQREGNSREARIAFEDAVAKPNPNPELVHMLLNQHLASTDFLGALDLVDQQSEKAPLSRLLSGNWSDLQKHLDFELVSQGVKYADPSHEFLWKQILGDGDVTAFTQQNKDSLLGQLLRLDDSGERLPAELAGRRFPSKDQRAFVLGQANELIGNYSQARELFGQVGESSPYRYTSELYLGMAKNRQKAAQLVEIAANATLAIESRRRLEAILLLRRAGKNDLLAARNLLEELVDGTDVDLNDRRLLALCLERLDDPDAARKQLLSVVESMPSAQNLAALIDFLLRNGNSDEARDWLEQLEDQSGWSRTAIALRTRWMAATDRLKEIKPMVELFAQKQFRRNPDDVASEMRSIAAIYRDVNLLDDAKRWLKILAKRFPNQAEPLSFLLVENDETEGAIQRCVERLSESPSASTATLLARILVYGDVTKETMNQVQPLLNESIKQFPKDSSLLFAVGNLSLKQERPEEAIRLLSKVTKLRPGHYLAWNNLAALLAEQDGRFEEALSTIETALSYAAYDIPTLYDTKAVVLMHGEKYEEAANLLTERVTKSNRGQDPRFYFHLALSLDHLNKQDAAKQAFIAAEDLDLQSKFLTRYEQKELARLREKLAIAETQVDQI